MLYLLIYWTLVWYCENATPVRDRNHYAAIKKLFLVPQILKNSFFWLICKSFALGKYKLTENPADSNLDNLPWKVKSQLSQTLQEPHIYVYIKITLETPTALFFSFCFFLSPLLSSNYPMFITPLNFGNSSLVSSLWQGTLPFSKAGWDYAFQKLWEVLCNEQDSPFGLLKNSLTNNCTFLSVHSQQQYWQFSAVWYINFVFILW